MEIYECLKKDHVEVRELLNELISLRDDDDYRFTLIEQIGQALIPHSRAEESVLYNTLRAVNADKSLVMHGYKEHMEAEGLLRTLQIKDKINLDWKSTARKLLSALEHHIEEEESEIFTEARAAFSAAEAESMGAAFEQLKTKVAGQSALGTTVDMFINLMPPRLADSLRNFGQKSAH